MNRSPTDAQYLKHNYPASNLQTHTWRYSSPGPSTVEENSGRLGLSGKMPCFQRQRRPVPIGFAALADLLAVEEIAPYLGGHLSSTTMV